MHFLLKNKSPEDLLPSGTILSSGLKRINAPNIYQLPFFCEVLDVPLLSSLGKEPNMTFCENKKSTSEEMLMNDI